MKIDLAGPERCGRAMGLNEFAGYLPVAVPRDRLRRVAMGAPAGAAYLVVGFVLVGLALSAVLVRETPGTLRFRSARQRPYT